MGLAMEAVLYGKFSKVGAWVTKPYLVPVFLRSNSIHCLSFMNRPFPSSCLPPLQSESKCEVFVMVITSTLHMNET